MLNTKFIADWQAIKARKQQIAHKNNMRENSKCLIHQYKVGDQVLLDEDPKSKYDTKYSGPYRVYTVNNDNGTVKIKKGSYYETINIRNLYPFNSPAH